MPVLVGRFGRAHGLRGEIAVEVRTDVPEVRFAPGAVLHCCPSAEQPMHKDRHVTLEGARVHGGRLLVSLEGLLDRTAVEPLTGLFLFADAPLDESTGDDDEFFDRQLIGLQVVDADGGHLGRVAEVAHLPGQDLLVVSDGEASEFLVPFVGEIVVSVDLAAGLVVVNPPSGLFDLDASD
ncbi:MAG: ribosome maturation factor RimM [Candidatus Nanopelagicales bacterium]